MLSDRPDTFPGQMNGLTLPHLSAYDPDTLGEGTMWPLGLAGIADRLADLILPGLRARMNRIRFLTAIAVRSAVTADLEDIPPGDGVSTPALVFEWYVIEAIARRDDLPREATQSVPGIDKARAARTRDAHLDAQSYLKTPKVFGFHGVYNPLAQSLEIVDRDMGLGLRGAELVGVWEREQELPGLLDGQGGDGTVTAKYFREEIRKALQSGRITTKSRSYIWHTLRESLRPDGAGPQERKLLWQWLRDETEPIRSELAGLVATVRDQHLDEAEVLRAVRGSAGRDLKQRLDAILAYEHLANLLMAAYDQMRYLCSQQAGPLSFADAAKNEVVAHAAGETPAAFRRAIEELEAHDLAHDLDVLVGEFAHPMQPADFASMLVTHHERIQGDKPPNGKRSWFDREPDGVRVRIAYEVDEPTQPDGSFVHPYRIHALRQFVDDLQP